MKDFLKKPYNYFLILISIPALVLLYVYFEQLLDYVKYGFSITDTVLSSTGLFLLLLVAWWTNLLRERSRILKITGIILAGVLLLVYAVFLSLFGAGAAH